ncbi:hypothetical protein TrST_g13635 [Triparma strigata]|uniref:Mitochondrial carrier protein n=1 Tax=Triparma strigata TaxID=1606541 RepID=A0A9W7BY79_9STRA|nr:hypothetical protein TrST_g13635 [Triparma strigata]
MTQRKRTPTALVNYFSGVLGGIAVTFVGHPFDTIKVRLQTQPTCPSSGEGMLYKSTVDCVKQTFRGEGLRGFYAGVASPLVGQMYFRAGSFAAFHYIHSIVESNLNPTTNPSPSHNSDSNTSKYKRLILSGGITGAFISILENPIDVIKTKLQVLIMKEKVNKSYQKPFHDTPSCVRFLVNKYGVSGLFHGFTATMIRNVPANAVFFPVNEIMKDILIKKNGYKGEAELSILERLGCGACAGFSYWVGTCPLDCIKSQMMMMRQEQNMTWLKTAKGMYREGGVGRFYQGLVPLAARSIPACGAMFATVDFARNYMTG